jgi:hypothetical protein
MEIYTLIIKDITTIFGHNVVPSRIECDSLEAMAIKAERYKALGYYTEQHTLIVVL